MTDGRISPASSVGGFSRACVAAPFLTRVPSKIEKNALDCPEAVAASPANESNC
jgi:hypothetical protein